MEGLQGQPPPTPPRQAAVRCHLLLSTDAPTQQGLTTKAPSLADQPVRNPKMAEARTPTWRAGEIHGRHPQEGRSGARRRHRRPPASGHGFHRKIHHHSSRRSELVGQGRRRHRLRSKAGTAKAKATADQAEPAARGQGARKAPPSPTGRNRRQRGGSCRGGSRSGLQPTGERRPKPRRRSSHPTKTTNRPKYYGEAQPDPGQRSPDRPPPPRAPNADRSTTKAAARRLPYGQGHTAATGPQGLTAAITEVRAGLPAASPAAARRGGGGEEERRLGFGSARVACARATRAGRRCEVSPPPLPSSRSAGSGAMASPLHRPGPRPRIHGVFAAVAVPHSQPPGGDICPDRLPCRPRPRLHRLRPLPPSHRRPDHPAPVSLPPPSTTPRLHLPRWPWLLARRGAPSLRSSRPRRRPRGRAVDFSFEDYLLGVTGARCQVWDVRDGRVLLGCLYIDMDDESFFWDLAVCDPLDRRCLLLPPLVAPVKMHDYEYHAEDSGALLVPSRYEGDGTSFRVLVRIVFTERMVTFIFSSASGHWSAGTSVSWNALGIQDLEDDCVMVSSSYMYGCFYWRIKYQEKWIKLDMNSMKIPNWA
ncbi:hypothetical protein U9M48_037453 [Paspalum notatum var. saurae]|uniref:Uncharacterized protein n=1 Tax=Paspalum notatum var. saurae TaxID=547442 RepID=A0AAQ3XCF2_PASNO